MGTDWYLVTASSASLASTPRSPASSASSQPATFSPLGHLDTPFFSLPAGYYSLDQTCPALPCPAQWYTRSRTEPLGHGWVTPLTPGWVHTHLATHSFIRTDLHELGSSIARRWVLHLIPNWLPHPLHGDPSGNRNPVSAVLVATSQSVSVMSFVSLRWRVPMGLSLLSWIVVTVCLPCVALWTRCHETLDACCLPVLSRLSYRPRKVSHNRASVIQKLRYKSGVFHPISLRINSGNDMSQVTERRVIRVGNFWYSLDDSWGNI